MSHFAIDQDRLCAIARRTVHSCGGYDYDDRLTLDMREVSVLEVRSAPHVPAQRFVFPNAGEAIAARRIVARELELCADAHSASGATFSLEVRCLLPPRFDRNRMRALRELDTFFDMQAPGYVSLAESCAGLRHAPVLSQVAALRELNKSLGQLAMEHGLRPFSGHQPGVIHFLSSANQPLSDAVTLTFDAASVRLTLLVHQRDEISREFDVAARVLMERAGFRADRSVLGSNDAPRITYDLREAEELLAV